MHYWRWSLPESFSFFYSSRDQAIYSSYNKYFILTSPWISKCDDCINQCDCLCCFFPLILDFWKQTNVSGSSHKKRVYVYLSFSLRIGRNPAPNPTKSALMWSLQKYTRLFIILLFFNKVNKWQSLNGQHWCVSYYYLIMTLVFSVVKYNPLRHQGVVSCKNL